MSHDPNKRIDLDEYELGSQERHIARQRNEELRKKQFAEDLLASIPTRPVLDLDVDDLTQSAVRQAAEVDRYDQELARRDAARRK
jgi:hypothetical protein